MRIFYAVFGTGLIAAAIVGACSWGDNIRPPDAQEIRPTSNPPGGSVSQPNPPPDAAVDAPADAHPDGHCGHGGHGDDDDRHGHGDDDDHGHTEGEE